MRRRHFLAGLSATVAFWRSATAALAKPAVIGRLHPGSASDPELIRTMQAFKDGMRALGHRDGETYRMEVRYAEGNVARLPSLAAELVQMKVDVIVTAGVIATQEAKAATSDIPIVMAMSGPDPVGLGLVASITRPGANVTGFTGLTDELPVKQLELLREIVPGLTDVLVLYNPNGSTKPAHTLTIAAASLGLRLHPVAVTALQDIDNAFAGTATPGRFGVIVLADPIIMDRSRGSIAERAVRHRLPLAASFRFGAEAGALLSYAENLADMHRRSASFVDKILRGAKPADLPIEQPTKFELLVNLKTARVLGIELPTSIMARADEVIE